MKAKTQKLETIISLKPSRPRMKNPNMTWVTKRQLWKESSGHVVLLVDEVHVADRHDDATMSATIQTCGGRKAVTALAGTRKFLFCWDALCEISVCHCIMLFQKTTRLTMIQWGAGASRKEAMESVMSKITCGLYTAASYHPERFTFMALLFCV